MAPTDRAALAKLAAIAGYSDEHLTLIAEANMPRYRQGDELTDTQISSLYSAAETCYESGLRGTAVAATVERHQQSNPADWRTAFWQERLSRADGRDALPAAPEPQPLQPPPTPVPVPASRATPTGEFPDHAAQQPANVPSGTADRTAVATAPVASWAGEVPIALDAADVTVEPMPGPIAPEPVAAELPAAMPSAIEPQPPPQDGDGEEIGTPPVPQTN
jgi:hypothetical protein